MKESRKIKFNIGKKNSRREDLQTKRSKSKRKRHKKYRKK